MVFSYDVINDLLSLFKPEIHVNIRHGYPLRIQETFKKQTVLQRVQFRDSHRVGYHASRSASSSRADRNVVLLREMNIVPDDQKIIDVPHGTDCIQLIFQAVADFLRDRMVEPFRAVIAQLLKISP